MPEQGPTRPLRHRRRAGQDLRRFARGDPIEARPLSTLERIGRRAWRKRGAVAAALVSLLLVLTSGLLLQKHRQEELAARRNRYDENVLRAMVLLEYGQARAPGRKAARRSGPPDQVRDYGFPLEPAIESAAGPDPVEEALDLAGEALRLVPERPEARYHQARGLLLLGKESEARRVLDSIASPRGGFPPARVLREAWFTETAPGSGQAGGEAASAPGWEVAYVRAQRAAFERRREEAVAACGELIEHLLRHGEPYRGALLEARLARGRTQLELGDLDEALVDFAAVQALLPAGALEPALLLARTYLRKGRAGSARRELESLLERTPFKGEAAVRAAELLHDWGEDATALELTRSIEEPSRRDQWRALCFAGLGRQQEALETARELARREPGSYSVQHTLGSVLLQGGSVEEAIQAYREAVRLQDRNPRSWRSLGSALLERAQYETHDYEEALQVFTRAAELDPRDPNAKSTLGFIHLQMGDVAEARKWVERALELDPRSPSAANGMGLVLTRAGDPDGAIGWFKKAIELAPRAVAPWSNLGWEYRKKDLFDEGIAACRKALELDPHHAETWKILGNNCYHKGELAGARDAFERFIELKPRNALGHHNLATLLERLEDFEGAIVRYQQAIQLEPEGVEWGYNLGNVYLRLRRFEEAMEAYRRTLQHHPDHTWTHFNLAEALAESGRLGEAAGHYEKAVELDPKDPEAYLALAGVHEKRGERSRAIEVLKKGLLAAPPPEPGKPPGEASRKLESRLKELEGGPGKTD